ncbi:MAG: hypothetical protein AAF703_22210, partial [Cyanobacteria bacterium P01_D01_bin.105]
MNDPNFITDDTDLSLLERTNFQTINRVDSNAVDAFVDDVDALRQDRVHFSRSPYVRLGLAAAGGTLFLGLGMLLFSGNQDTQVAEESAGGVDTPVEEITGTLTLGLEPDGEPVSNEDTAEVDRLRAELALLQQQMALAEIDRSAQAALAGTSAVDSPAREKTTTPETSVATRPTARPTATSALPVTRPVSAVRPAPRPVSVPRAVPATARQTTVPAIVQPVSAASEDPNDVWATLSSAGVFGSMPTVKRDSPIQEEKAFTPIEIAPVIDVPRYQLKRSDEQPIETAQRTSEIPGLFSARSNYVPIGRRTAATVVTPIIWLG